MNARHAATTAALALAAMTVGGLLLATATTASAQDRAPARVPGMERMHQQMTADDPGMERMRELYRGGNPGMDRMHALMTDGAR